MLDCQLKILLGGFNVANDDQRGIIGFRTSDDWLAEDFAKFVLSVTNIYNALLTVRIKARLQEEYIQYLEDYLENALDQPRVPIDNELYRFWRNQLRLLRKFGFSYSFNLPFSPATATYPNFRESFPSDKEIFENLDLYATADDLLRIHRIRISSPGVVNFSGLGEIVKEVREFIKDIWYRNRQEKAIAQLDLLDKYLKMRRENPDVNLPLPPDLRKDRYLVDVVEGNVKVLRELESGGKLEALDGDVDQGSE